MHPSGRVTAVLRLAEAGVCATDIGRQLGIPRSTVRAWLGGSVPHRDRPGGCDRCGGDHRFSELAAQYVYLLAMYLGDGSIATHARQVYRLRFSLDARYPEIIDECSAAIRNVAPANRVGRVSRGTWYEVYCYSKMWPCVLPQHGPGKKHDRSIVLTDWQKPLVERWPEHLLRGLIHSDGCRFENTGRGNWSCPRYAFTNRSRDIRSIFCDACDLLAVHWTAAGDQKIYVSRKADVARLDTFIGPKK